MWLGTRLALKWREVSHRSRICIWPLKKWWGRASSQKKGVSLWRHRVEDRKLKGLLLFALWEDWWGEGGGSIDRFVVCFHGYEDSWKGRRKSENGALSLTVYFVIDGLPTCLSMLSLSLMQNHGEQIDLGSLRYLIFSLVMLPTLLSQALRKLYNSSLYISWECNLHEIFFFFFYHKLSPDFKIRYGIVKV